MPEWERNERTRRPVNSSRVWRDTPKARTHNAPLPPAARNQYIYPTKTTATDSLRQQIKHKAEPKKS